MNGARAPRRNSATKEAAKGFFERMLTEAFPQLQKSALIKRLNEFFRSEYYMALVVGIMTIAELFGLELFAYYCYTLLAVVITLFAEDTLGHVPLACCFMFTFSARNSARNNEVTIFDDQSAFLQIVVLGSICFIAGFARLMKSAVCGKSYRFPALTAGFAVLGFSYLFGGMFSPYFGIPTFMFGLLQVLFICVLYFYFRNTVKWEKTPREYLITLLFILGVGIACQSISMYFNEGVFTECGVNRGYLYVGWGSYNLVGVVMAICMPAPFYFAVTRRNGWAYSIVGTVYWLFLLIIQSRGAIVAGTVVYAICALYTLIKAKGRARLEHAIVFVCMIVALIVSIFLFRKPLSKLFASLLEIGKDSTGRFPLYRDAWNNFCKYPFFGVGWGGGDSETLPWIEAPFWLSRPFYAHNTFFQLISTGGLMMLLAYGFHRAQTIALIMRNPTKSNLFLGFSLLALLLTSMFDYHIFSYCTLIVYSVILSFCETKEQPKKIQEK